MKRRVLMRHQARAVLAPILGLWIGLAVLVSILALANRLVGNTAPLAIPIIGLWQVAFVVVGYTRVAPWFALGMQTGISRRHILESTLACLTAGIVITLVGYGLWRLALPATPQLLPDLGYRGAIGLNEWCLNASSLVLAAAFGVCARLLVMFVGRGLGVLLILAAVLWLSNSQQVGRFTRNIANGLHGYLWPVLLLAGAALLIVASNALMQVVEPDTK